MSEQVTYHAHLAGRAAELAARDYLTRQGLTFREANFHCRFGEIDLIMQDQETLVFVEVRYRHNSRWQTPVETINYAKQKKLLRTADYYLQRKHSINANCRFDVVGITGNNPEYSYEWLKDAIMDE